MRIIGTFAIRTIAGEVLAIPTGSAMEHFSGIISLNPVSEFLFTRLSTEQTEESLLAALLAEYAIDEATARQDLQEFLSVLRANALLTE